MSPPLSRRPSPDRRAAQTLRGALDRLGYTEEAVAGLLGEDAYDAGRTDVPVYERRLDRSRLATAVRLLFLELPVSHAEGARAFGARGLAALETTGLAEVGAEILPHARVLPLRNLLLASDGYTRDADDPPDYVAGYSVTSRLCDLLTPRARVERALDVGTGNGVQALLAARHSRRVLATDVNPRALAYTELNAALNGLANVECRGGSLFEAAAGVRFDLVTCNAPFVVSPEHRWAYRDSGMRGDEVSARIVRDAAECLREGGFATVLVSWLARDEDAPDERALAWIEGMECDAWLLSIFGADPLDHAAAWNPHLADDPEAYAAALDGWTDYLRALEARWVTEGAVLLHRRSGRRHSVRLDAIDADALEVADRQIRTAFRARARLAGLGRAAELLETRPARAMAIRLEEELGGRRQAGATLGEGTRTSVRATAGALAVVRRLDGRTSLAAAVDEVAAAEGLSRAEAARLRRRAQTLVRELLELGALRLA